MSLTIQQGLQKLPGPYQNPRKVVDKQAFSSILEQNKTTSKSRIMRKSV